jgi:hypothetical protein
MRQNRNQPIFFAHRKSGIMAEDKERPEQSAARSGAREISEAEIDQNLIGTFPASDPPSWTLGVERTKKPDGLPATESQQNKNARFGAA